MDSPVLSQLFRQLFRHPACQSLRSSSALAGRRAQCIQLSTPRQQCRPFLTRRSAARRKNVDDGMNWNKRGDYPKDIEQELKEFPLVTAKDLRHRRERPRQVKMLTREFIDGMLSPVHR